MRELQQRTVWFAMAIILLLGAAGLSGCALPEPEDTLATLAANATASARVKGQASSTGTPQASQAATRAITAAASGTALTSPASPTGTPPATPQPKVTSAPTVAPTKAGCSQPVDDRLQAAYAAAGGFATLGCPAALAADEQWALQPFEHGIMFWRGVEKAIYLAREDGSFKIRADLWDESLPEYACGSRPPAGFLQPKRGFGLLWCESDINAYFGWAVIEEASITYRVQRFQNAAGDFALLVVPAFGQVYAFYTDYTWVDVMTIVP